jgi:hypothetical protein
MEHGETIRAELAARAAEEAAIENAARQRQLEAHEQLLAVLVPPIPPVSSVCRCMPCPDCPPSCFPAPATSGLRPGTLPCHMRYAHFDGFIGNLESYSTLVL